MSQRLEDAKILMYSHDTFGLGHLRRCRTIAHALVDSYPGMNVLIMSGATIAGAFDYRAGVDFVKIPSVIKLRDGEYMSMNQHVDFHDTLKMRQSIIRHTAETFEPDIFIVDKEPMGLRREVEDTLVYLKTRGTRLVLGLRDVMDAPHLLKPEWKRHDVVRKIDQLYDDVWIYGPPDFYDPLDGLDVPATVRAKMNFVGFLQRQSSTEPRQDVRDRDDYILVTTGGGGDGSDLIRDVINAYRSDPTLTQRALVVLGPYMPVEQRLQWTQAGEEIPWLEIIEFDNRMEDLIAGARAVVAMGGYNTYCEILSFDKPALIIPRTRPREEQLIRAVRASELGLVDMLHPDESVNGHCLAQALKKLLERAPPSVTAPHMRLDGLSNICDIVSDSLRRTRGDHLSVIQGGLSS